VPRKGCLAADFSARFGLCAPVTDLAVVIFDKEDVVISVLQDSPFCVDKKTFLMQIVPALFLKWNK
jgi:hypothetical protein